MMGQLIQNDETGEIVWLADNGQIQQIEEPGLLAQAGRQIADLGSGIKAAYGTLAEQPALVNQARAETTARNQVFAPADAAFPVQSMVGQAIPSLATAPITGGASVVGQLAANVGIGAAESALDLGEGGSFAERGAAGALGGILGDLGGRMIGRVVGGAKGLIDDIRLGRGVAENPVAAEAEQMGLRTLASQRMAPGSQAQRQMQRLEQSAEASIFPPGLQREAAEGNAEVFRDTAMEAIGLPAGSFDNLGPDALREANEQLAQGFEGIAAQASAAGDIPVGEQLAERIAGTRGQIRQLIARGELPGLQNGVLRGADYTTARAALAEDAANAAARGEYRLAESLFDDVDQLDALIEPNLAPDALQEFARLREQYRVFKILNGSGVINQAGDVSVRNLNRKLQGGTGFGNTARQGLDTVNPESSRLIDVARIGANPELQPFRSSGTAENQALRDFLGQLATQPVAAAGQLAAPVAVAASSRGGGRGVAGLVSPAPAQARVAGSAAGRGLLDELFYPFIGSEDDTRQ